MTNSRRDFLKLAGMLGLGAALPYTASAQAPVGWHSPINSRSYRFLLGNFEALLISDGDAQFPTRQVFAPEATDEQLYGLLKNYYLPTEKTAFYFNVLLVNTGKDLILVDTGVGAGLGGNAGRLLAGLQQVGLTPEQVTAVVLTHAHFDHFGGLLTPEGKPFFTKAQHYVATEEWDFWNGKKPASPALKPRQMRPRKRRLSKVPKNICNRSSPNLSRSSRAPNSPTASPWSWLPGTRRVTLSCVSSRARSLFCTSPT